MTLDKGKKVTLETEKQEEVVLEGQEDDSTEEELMDLLATDEEDIDSDEEELMDLSAIDEDEDELIDLSAIDEDEDEDEDDYMKGISDIVSGADAKRDEIKEKMDMNAEIGEEKVTDSMTMEEIFGVKKLTVANFEKVCRKSKVNPKTIMEIFDVEKGTLDVTETINIIYGGRYVKDIVKRMREFSKKKILQKREGVETDMDGITDEKDEIIATKKLVGELDAILAKTGGQETFLEKIANKAEGIGAIKFLMDKTGYLDTALQNKVDTLGDALGMLENLDQSYAHRTQVLSTTMESNHGDYKTLKKQRRKVNKLQEIVHKVFHLRKGSYERMTDNFTERYQDLSESKQAESLTYKKEFYDEILQLAKLVKSIDQYSETLEVLEISTRTHLKILKSLYQTLLTSYPQVEAILTALLQQMDNASIEHQVIDTEETIRGSIATGMTLMRKSTAKAAKSAEKLAIGSVFESGVLKKENIELRKIENSFDKVRAGLLKERETITSVIEEVEEIAESRKIDNRLEAVLLDD